MEKEREKLEIRIKIWEEKMEEIVREIKDLKEEMKDKVNGREIEETEKESNNRSSKIGRKYRKEGSIVLFIQI